MRNTWFSVNVLNILLLAHTLTIHLLYDVRHLYINPIYICISISVSTVTSRRDTYTHAHTHTFIRAKEEGDDRREKKLNQNQYLWESDRFWTIPNYQIDNKSQQNVIEFNLATENAQTIRLKVIIANLLMIRCLSFTPIVKWPIK